MSKTLEELYYNDLAKDCKNCVHYRSWTIALSKCKLFPNWLTADAFKTCQYDDWQPNQKLYDKFEKKGQ